MTKRQIDTLKLLGYQDTDEDGAILEHSKYSYWSDINGPRLDFVWKDDTFQYILLNYTYWVELCAQQMAINEIERSIRTRRNNGRI
jgi:hypothetical protein